MVDSVAEFKVIRGFLQVQQPKRQRRDLRRGGGGTANIGRAGRGGGGHIYVDKKGKLQFVYVHIM